MYVVVSKGITHNDILFSQVVLKNPPANAGEVRDVGLIHGSGRSPAGGHGNPLQSSCLENPMERGAWRSTVHMMFHRFCFEKNCEGLQQAHIVQV